ncbi:MAG: glycosyltransferase family 2 protein [Oscillospiraceae bacterium]|nr:glycosyltransferase family 2 protein [Oscillospiraceae bacterium]
MQENTVKISVLVPVCNVARFLPRCLDSLTAQTMQDIEILMIDDGSTDESGEICAAYAARDGRFRLIRQENRGLFGAWNRGLDEAGGEYLMFVDGDDWVEPDFCETPWRCASEQDADLVLFRYRRASEEGEPFPAAPVSVPVGRIDRDAALDLLFGAARSYVWNKLWRKRLFEGVRFPAVIAFEDVGTTYRLVLRAERILSLDRVLYYYRKRRGSNVTLRTDRAMRDYYAMHTARYEALRELGYNPRLLRERRAAVCLTYAMRRREDPADPASLRVRQTLRELPAVPKRLRRSQRLLIFLLRRCPPLFELSCRLLKRRTKGK